MVTRTVRARLRSAHRDWTLGRALARFAGNPTSGTLSTELIRSIEYGWGNAGWSANETFLRACLDEIEGTRGLIVECGSGMSTLILGLAAQRLGRRYVALENDAQWVSRVRARLERMGVSHITVVHAPLVDIGEQDWYDLSRTRFDESVTLAICDGPPGSTRGGRAGMMPALFRHLAPGAVVLVDDADREAEWQMVQSWMARYGLTGARLGAGRQMYGRLCLPPLCRASA